MQELIGQVLAGRYRVEAFIGRGAMAEVYKVWDQHRMTHLAMKLLHEDMAVDRVFMRRFQREAQTLAKLQHPGIVRFYGLERDGRRAFMLMDFIEGENLKPKIFDADGPYPLEEIRTTMRSVCSALHYAHREGTVHCDIKPGNIMINAHNQVLLTDFGIARMTDAATATMVGAGTPAYMAPEQARGLDPTPQTDIYALGIVLYEMLTGGERPFTGERATVTGSTSEKVRWEQMNLQPPSPRQYNPEISPELENVVMKCLAKEPGERYANAIDLLEALEAAIGESASTPVTGAAVPEEDVARQAEASEDISDSAEPEKASRHSRRKSLLGGVGGVAIILLIILAAMWGRSGGGPLSILAIPTSTSTPTVISTSTLTSTNTMTPSAIATETLTSTSTPVPSSTPEAIPDGYHNVPDFIGLSLPEVETIMLENALSYTVSYFLDSSVPAGTVIEQSPISDELIRIEDKIKITVSYKAIATKTGSFHLWSQCGGGHVDLFEGAQYRISTTDSSQTIAVWYANLYQPERQSGILTFIAPYNGRYSISVCQGTSSSMEYTFYVNMLLDSPQ